MHLATYRFRSAVAIAVLTAATLFLPSPAEAGGPTSALLSIPGSGNTASLYYTDPEYDALAGMLGADIGDGTTMADTSGQSHAAGPGVTVTWLIHDVTPWRVDRIYLLGKGAPWIVTQLADESGNIWNSPEVWHKPASPTKLVALLDQLGVGQSTSQSSTFGGGDDTTTSPAAVEPAAAATQPTSTESNLLTGIWWGVGGLFVGAVGALLWVRRGRLAVDTSRDELFDEKALKGYTVAEELS